MVTAQFVPKSSRSALPRWMGALAPLVSGEIERELSSVVDSLLIALVDRGVILSAEFRGLHGAAHLGSLAAPGEDQWLVRFMRARDQYVAMTVFTTPVSGTPGVSAVALEHVFAEIIEPDGREGAQYMLDLAGIGSPVPASIDDLAGQLMNAPLGADRWADPDPQQDPQAAALSAPAARAPADQPPAPPTPDADLPLTLALDFGA